MQTFLAAHTSNLILILLLLVYIVCLNGMFSLRRCLLKFRRLFLFLFFISIGGLIIGTIRNELTLFWFNNASFNIESSFELSIKIIYDLISIAIMTLMIVLVINIFNFFKNNSQTVIRKVSINTNIIAILIIVRTVIIPLVVKIVRVLQLFGLNNNTSSSNDVFLYALPYLGLPEVAIIVVTIFINILGLNYCNRGDDHAVAK